MKISIFEKTFFATFPFTKSLNIFIKKHFLFPESLLKIWVDFKINKKRKTWLIRKYDNTHGISYSSIHGTWYIDKIKLLYNVSLNLIMVLLDSNFYVFRISLSDKMWMR